MCVGFDDLRDIIVAGYCLKFKDLPKLCCQAMADKINNKNIEAIREIFGIEYELTLEEVAEFRKIYSWAFEGEEIDDTTNSDYW